MTFAYREGPYSIGAGPLLGHVTRARAGVPLLATWLSGAP